jgi:addiction module RelE/StbE family toxin
VLIALLWTQPAAADLAVIADHLRDEAGIVVAHRTIELLHAAATGLVRFPERGRPGRVAGTRELIVAPYVIAYRVRPKAVQILRVLHGARRWPNAL